jgi:hypothetical protein
MVCKQCLLYWTWHITEKTVSAKRRDNKTLSSSFLAVAINSQLTIAFCGRNCPLYNLQLKITFLLQSQLTVNPQLSLWPESTFCTIHSWKPSLAVSIDICTITDRNPLQPFSYSCNWQWPTIVSVARINLCTKMILTLQSQLTAKLQLSLWPESTTYSWKSSLVVTVDSQFTIASVARIVQFMAENLSSFAVAIHSELTIAFCGWNCLLYNSQLKPLSLAVAIDSQSTIALCSQNQINSYTIYSWK